MNPDDDANEVLQEIDDFLPRRDLLQTDLVSLRLSYLASNSLWHRVTFGVGVLRILTREEAVHNERLSS